MKVALASQMREIDRFSIDEMHIPGMKLMENAGRQIYYAIQKRFEFLYGKKCLCICGKGNNAGDGIVASRFLKESGALVSILLAENDIKSEDARHHLVKLKNADILKLSDEYNYILENLNRYDIIIDAVYGTGFKGIVNDSIALLFKKINNTKAYKVAADLPSGCNCDTGEISGACFNADLTVALGLPKPCHFIYPGALYTGKLVVADIGLLEKAISKQNLFIEIIEESFIDKILKTRERDTNKGSFGSLLSVCGSKGMSGAAFFAASAALRCGAGLVTVAAPECISDILASKLNEPLFLSLQDNGKTLSSSCTDELLYSLEKFSVCLFGCGVGINPDTSEILFSIIENIKIPLVIDADGITMLKENIHVLCNKTNEIVITPHPGEFARLLEITIEDIQSNRLRYSTKFAQEYNTVVVLKGANTVIAAPDGRTFINTNGNPGLAKGGSGDVLAGMIASFLTQGLPAFEASVCAVYLHGKAADTCAERLSEYGMLPSDMLTDIAKAFNKYNGV